MAAEFGAWGWESPIRSPRFMVLEPASCWTAPSASCHPKTRRRAGGADPAGDHRSAECGEIKPAQCDLWRDPRHRQPDVARPRHDDTSIERENRAWRWLTQRPAPQRHYGPEFFGINAASAIERSDVCVLVIDALDGVTEQDQRLAGRIEEDGRACVVVVNKWDAVEKDSHTMSAMEKELRAKLYFLDWAPMLFTSALTGQRVDSIFAIAALAVEQHRRRVSTSVVNEELKEA